MRYSYIDNTFSIHVAGLSREPGNIRNEFELKAREVSKTYPDVLISMSSGLDCQTVLHSFASQDLPFRCSFLHLKGCNDIELSQLEILERKYNFSSIIVQLDPEELRDRIIYESDLYNIQRNQILQKIYLEHLPSESHFLQRAEPFIYVDQNNKFLYYQGLHMWDTSRHRAFSKVERNGTFDFFENSSEFLFSLLSDETYQATLYSAKYFNNTFSVKYGLSLTNYDLWDNFTKPVMYGKYWKNELEYFPKYTGIEKVEYLNQPHRFTEHAVLIPLDTLLTNMKLGKDTTYVQNYHRLYEDK